MAYPTPSDLRAYIEHRGITAPDDAELQQRLDAAVAELERLTGYSPFIAETSASESTMDVSGSWVELRNGYVEVQEVKIDDDVLTLDDDYLLYPAEPPHTSIWLRAAERGKRQVLVITGRKGYSDVLPADVFLAIIARAATFVYASLGILNASSLREGGVAITYSETAQHGELSLWAGVITRYRRLSLGEPIVPIRR